MKPEKNADKNGPEANKCQKKKQDCDQDNAKKKNVRKSDGSGGTRSSVSEHVRLLFSAFRRRKNVNAMSSRDIGRFGEEHTVRYLRRRGYRILERNFIIPGAEIDIIAKRGKYIIFVEVKTRSALCDREKYGRARDSVDTAKQHRIRLAASNYIALHKCFCIPRCDIAEVYVSRSSAGLRATEFIYSEAAF